MKRINLIPAPRRDAQRRKKHARWCIAGCGIYAMLALLVAVACRFTYGDGREAAEQRLATADADVQHITATLSVARADLNAAKVALTVNQQLTAQPDWSLLLKYLAEQNGDSIVLKSCALNTRAEPAPSAAVLPVVQTYSAGGKTMKLPVVSAPRIVQLTLAGTGGSQLAVTQFVVRLEQTGLFRRVSVLDTSREAFLGGEAIAFRLECVLDEGDK